MSQRRVLVTGINGFVGKHLANELAANDIEVTGCGQETELSLELQDVCTTYESCDLSDPLQVARLSLDGVSAIVNLAGKANVGASRDNPDEYLQVNVAVHAALCDELLKRSLSPRIISISTGMVYSPNQPMPQTERGELVSDDIASPYAISKKRMEDVLQAYREEGLDIIIARPFNHIGPGQRPGFLVPDLADQIINTQDGVLMVGNLNTKRDYTDVRDVVGAYRLLALAESLHFDTYNVCSGVSRSGLEILELLKQAFNKGSLRVEIDPARIRQNDVLDIYGDSSRIRAELGWAPQIPTTQTIQDFASWRLEQ